MGRHRKFNPPIKVTISVDEECWQFMKGFKHDDEPMHVAFRRLLHNYNQKDIAPVVQELEEATKTVNRLRADGNKMATELALMRNQRFIA